MNGRPKAKLNCEKEFWPKEGTIVSQLPIDLAELWEKFENQASVFVAEALMGEDIFSRVDFDTCEIETFLWSVGGDVITKTENICELIEWAARDYNYLCSKEQADDIKTRLLGLDKIQKSIDEAREFMTNQITEFEKNEQSKT
jgi:hypothetical protein